ncbi:MAG: hypothetical protein ACUVQO_18555 [Leptodesmis sp.]
MEETTLDEMRSSVLVSHATLSYSFLFDLQTGTKLLNYQEAEQARQEAKQLAKQER